MGRQNATDTVEHSLAIQTIANRITIPKIPLQGIYTRAMEKNVSKYHLYKNDHLNIIHGSQNVWTIQMSIN